MRLRAVKGPKTVSTKMLATTSRIASAIIMASIFLSLHNINTFYNHQIESAIPDEPQSISSPSQRSPVKNQNQSINGSMIETTPATTYTDSKRQNETVKESVTERTPAIINTKSKYNGLNRTRVAPNSFNIRVQNDDTYQILGADNKRAIVIISMGQEAANTSMVERFVWSARNVGQYSGWIILVTDAEHERYANMSAAAIPVPSGMSRLINSSYRSRKPDTNTLNKFVVWRKQERRFSRITQKVKFKAQNTMSSKIFKTYILNYAKKDMRLANVDLFYYLDVDIVFGNPIQPLFANLEQKYKIGNLYDRFKEKTPGDAEEVNKGTIHFFEGNGRNQVQGGQFVLDKHRSQPCLDRWRELMIEQRQRPILKDQTQLSMMLEEQRQRAEEQRQRADSNPSNSTEEAMNECEIIIMEQDSKLIQFPELADIQNRSSDQEHPILVHFRNSANVMRDVDEETLQNYMRELLRFGENQEDEYGLLDKMLMKVDLKRMPKRKRRRRRRRRHGKPNVETNPQEFGNQTNTTVDVQEEGYQGDEVEHPREQDIQHEMEEVGDQHEEDDDEQDGQNEMEELHDQQDQDDDEQESQSEMEELDDQEGESTEDDDEQDSQHESQEEDYGYDDSNDDEEDNLSDDEEDSEKDASEWETEDQNMNSPITTL